MRRDMADTALVWLLGAVFSPVLSYTEDNSLSTGCELL